MTGDETKLRRDVLLTFQVALLGMVTPSLRGVTVRWDCESISAHCYYDGEVTEAETEVASDIEAEIVASFPDHEVEVLAKRLDYPDDLTSRTLTAWVYARSE